MSKRDKHRQERWLYDAEWKQFYVRLRTHYSNGTNGKPMDVPLSTREERPGIHSFGLSYHAYQIGPALLHREEQQRQEAWKQSRTRKGLLQALVTAIERDPQKTADELFMDFPEHDAARSVVVSGVKYELYRDGSKIVEKGARRSVDISDRTFRDRYVPEARRRANAAKR